MEIKISVDTRQVKRALKELGTRAPQAMMRALNRTARTARTQAVRAVAKEIRLPQKDIRPMLPVIPATSKHLEAQLVARGRPISLMRLGARQTKLGVIYRGPGGGPILVRSAFIARMPRAKRPSVWRRKGNPRLPIERLTASSVPSIVLERGIFESLRQSSRETLAKNLAHETENLLRQSGSRRG
jgi:hypothetical protein